MWEGFTVQGSVWVNDRELGGRDFQSREVNSTLGRLGGGRALQVAWLAAAEGMKEISRSLLPVKPLSSFQTGIVFPVSGSLFLLGSTLTARTFIDLQSQFKYFLPVKVFQFS